MSLRSADLNLVPVLQLLLRERSVSRAAEELGLSQPAVSAALRRLRVLFDDALLVRVGSGMALTPRAVALATEVDKSCAQLTTLLAPPIFDPGTAERIFVIAGLDQGNFLVGPDWMRVLASVAPGVQLRFVELSDQTVDQLTRREVDFALIPSFFVEDLPAAPLMFRSLFQDGQVALFARGHALGACETLTQEDIRRYRCVGFHPPLGWIERKRTSALLGHGAFDLISDVPQSSLIPFLLLDSDFYGIASTRAAERLSAVLPLDWRPFAFPTERFDVGLAWSHVQDSDPAHRWFRKVVAGIGS